MRNRLRLIEWSGARWALLVGLVVQSSCQTTQKSTRPSAAATPAIHSNKPPPGARRSAVPSTDPCASRLHDICGPLLLYYARNHQLPERLEELSKIPGFEEVRDFTCPISNKLYVYNPASKITSAPGAYVILYDSEPAHSGMRYAVTIQEPEGNGPPLTKIVALSESYFAGQPSNEPAR